MADDPVNFNMARADKLQDNTLVSPVELLEQCLRDIKSGATPVDSLMVIGVKHTDGGYARVWRACQLKASEMVSLLEIMKLDIIDDHIRG